MTASLGSSFGRRGPRRTLIGVPLVVTAAVALLFATAVPVLSAPSGRLAGPDAAAARPARPSNKPAKTPNPGGTLATPRPSPTPAATATPGSTATPTRTPSPTATPVPAPTATPAATPTPTPTPGGTSTFPVRAAFYYPWFPEAWNQSGLNPFTHYHPSAGFYTEDASTIASHIRAMQYGKISMGIASWWGQGTRTDQRVPLLLSTAAGTGFTWSIYYEPEGNSDPTVSQLQSDLAYIDSHYGSDPSFYRIGGRPVVFVYAQPADGCAMASRWAQANASKANYIVLKVFSGYATCADQPDQWHQYSPAVAADQQRGHSYAISPGFWLATDAAPRLVRDLARWQLNIRNMVASGEPLQLVTTFNEWGEGTAVENATEWSSGSGYGAYLDALHFDGQPAP